MQHNQCAHAKKKSPTRPPQQQQLLQRAHTHTHTQTRMRTQWAKNDGDTQTDMPCSKRGQQAVNFHCKAQCAFEDSMIRGILQFTPHFAAGRVLHRCTSQEIHRCKLCFFVSTSLSLKCVRIHTHTGESDFMKFDKYTDTHMYMRASMASSFAQGKFKKERPQLTHAVESREQTVKVACINSNAHASHCTECWLLPHTHINVHGNKTNFLLLLLLICCCCCE